MILYTPVPLEIVYEGYDQFSPQYEEIEHLGVQMLIEPIGTYQGKIVRLLSGNPQHFLNPTFMPGSIISFRPQ